MVRSLPYENYGLVNTERLRVSKGGFGGERSHAFSLPKFISNE